MNALWIIGNGFDLNVGLRTGYRHFLEDVYMKDGDHSEHRDALIELVGEDPRLVKGKYWSDLESLLAFTTSKCPEQISERDFTGIFQEMQKLFVGEVATEQLRLTSPIPEEAVSEFRDSIMRVSARMRPRDQRTLPCNLTADENITWKFVSLNYTTVFDTFLYDAIERKGSDLKRHFGGRYFVDSLSKNILHPHGIISDNFDGSEIIFGASASEQFAVDDSTGFELLNELWVKPNKNREIYGNENTEHLSELVSNARVFLLYGVSLGESDQYIWEMIGKRMVETSVWTVVFEHGMPRSSSQDSLLYLEKRRQVQNRLLDVAGIDDENRDGALNRIIVVSAAEYFAFGGMTLVSKTSDGA